MSIDVDAQLLHLPGHPPVPVERRDLWKFMSRKLVDDRQCWASAYSSSQSTGIPSKSSTGVVGMVDIVITACTTCLCVLQCCM